MVKPVTVLVSTYVSRKCIHLKWIGGMIDRRWERTWWEGLLELLDLLGILQDQGVEVSLASDLELDL